MDATLLRLGIFLVVLGVMAAWEYVAPRRQLSSPRRRRWPTNLGLGFLNALLIRVVVLVAAFSAAVFADERGVGLLHWIALPGWVGWAIALLGLDLAIYLQHVMFHAVPALWRVHRVHHADLGFDATTGLRFHPIEMLISLGIRSAVILLLGAAPAAVVAFEILLSASSLFSHGNAMIPESADRWLRWLIVTPDMHRIHHSTRVIETSSNFGFSFSWWDRLCGSYRAESVLGPLGLEIGLAEYRKPLALGQLLLLPFKGSAGSRTFAGTRPVRARLR